MATSAMSVHERVAMLNLFTSSPETESPETSPCGVREPSVGAEAAPSRRAASVRIVRGSPWDCLAWEVHIRLKKAHLPARDSSHQPCFHFRFSRKAQALLATPARDARIEMSQMRSTAATKPSPIPDETARLFQVALHDVVRSSALSMAELRECVKACVGTLRDTNVGPAQMIISMKACAKEGTRRYPQTLNDHELSNADFLMDQIIKWAIVEYYSDA